jgi:hypothetical protein
MRKNGSEVESRRKWGREIEGHGKRKGHREEGRKKMKIRKEEKIMFDE